MQIAMLFHTCHVNPLNHWFTDMPKKEDEPLEVPTPPTTPIDPQPPITDPDDHREIKEPFPGDQKERQLFSFI